MDPKAFEQLILAAQQQPAPMATPVTPVDPTAALLRQPASGPVIRGPSGMARKAKPRVDPKATERAIAESANADREAEMLLQQLFAPQQKAVQGFRDQRDAMAEKEAAPSWATPLLA